MTHRPVISRPGMTSAVDWALKANYLCIYPVMSSDPERVLRVLFCFCTIVDIALIETVVRAVKPTHVAIKPTHVAVKPTHAAVCGSVGQTRRAFLARRAYHQCWRVRVRFPSGTLDFLL